MGTRNVTFVYYHGKYQIAQFCQWDGYPLGQGCKVLAFLLDPSNVAKLKSVIDAGHLYEPTTAEQHAWVAQAASLHQDWSERNKLESRKRLEWIESQVECVDEPRNPPRPQPCRHHHRTRATDYEPLPTPLESVCPTLSPDTGARILRYAAAATGPFPVIRSFGFGGIVEWAYVVDLDGDGAFEVFGRCDGREVPSARFEGVEWAQQPPGAPPCAGRWPLAALPTKEEFRKYFGEE